MHLTTRQTKELRQYLEDKGVVKHPTKRHINFIDGDNTNWDLNNLVWSNTSEYMGALGGMNYNTTQAEYNKNLAEFRKTDKRILMGALVPIQTSGTYPVLRKPLPKGVTND